MYESLLAAPPNVASTNPLLSVLLFGKVADRSHQRLEAVDQRMLGNEAGVSPGREIAFFSMFPGG
jgi:hypothetical protein